MNNELAAPAPSADRALAFELACARCGDFAPLYARWGSSWCRACLDRRPQLELEPPTWNSLCRASWELALRVHWREWLCLCAFGAPTQLWELLWPDRSILQAFVALAYHVCIMTFAIATLQRLIFLRVVTEPNASLASAAGHVLRRYRRLVATTFATTLIPLLYGLCFIVPGILRALDFTLALPISVNEGESVRAALRQSTLRMHGQRGAAAVASSLWWLPVSALGVVGNPDTWRLVHLTVPSPAFETALSLAVACLTTGLSLPSEMLPLALQLKLAAQPETPKR